MFRIKICGITRAEDAIAATRAGADALGLNMYTGSSRFVDAQRASAIVSDLRAAMAGSTSPVPSIVGVFVDAEVDHMVKRAAAVGLDAIQLHGDEPPDLIPRLGRRTGLPIVRAMALERHGEDAIIGLTNDAVARPFLGALFVDSASPSAEHFGGSGTVADWDRVAQIRKATQSTGIPLVLAGGLHPENVGRAVAATGVYGVDTATGVEVAPGIKDAAAIAEFVTNARAAGLG